MKASHSGRQCPNENLFKSLTQQKYRDLHSWPRYTRLSVNTSTWFSSKVLHRNWICKGVAFLWKFYLAHSYAAAYKMLGKTDARMAAVTLELVACCGTCSVTAHLMSNVVWLILPKYTNLTTHLCKTEDGPQKRLFCVPWLNFHQQPISPSRIS